MIDKKGISDRSEVGEFFAWKGINKIEKTKDYVLLYTDKLIAYFVPIRNFESPKQADDFYDAAMAYWRNAHTPS